LSRRTLRFISTPGRVGGVVVTILLTTTFVLDLISFFSWT
jgi:hypothetical protein